jgi:Fe-S cluster biogenesis protein NfuA
VEEVEAQLDALDALEPTARELAVGAVQGVLALYGEALARIMARLGEGAEALYGEAGGRGEAERDGDAAIYADPIEALLDDELIAHLLILHDLHPVDLSTRVERALAELRPYLQSRGGDAVLLRIDDGVIHLRLEGRCTEVTALQETIETTLRRAAPEVERISAEDAVAPAKLVQIGGRRG